MGMKNSKLLLILFFALAIIIGICSCNCNEACTYLDWKFDLVFKGLPDSITVKVKRYPKNSGFANCRDSASYTSFGSFQDNNTVESPLLDLIGNDSTDYLVTASYQVSGGGLATHYYSITDLSYPIASSKSCGKTCTYHSLQSCKVNGVVTNSVGFGDIILQ